MNFLKKLNKKDNKVAVNSKEAAKERLHLVLMQDRANVSADFLELMKQEIIEVIKKNKTEEHKVELIKDTSDSKNDKKVDKKEETQETKEEIKSEN